MWRETGELNEWVIEAAALGLGLGENAGRRIEASDFRHKDPRYQGENFDANMRAATVVSDIAKRKDSTPGRIALAWLLHKGPDIVPIPGTTRRTHLEDNVGAAAVSLSAEEMSSLDAALSPENVSGPRYTEKQMATVDR